MTNIEIKQLFEKRRFSDNELKIICLLLYLPVGLILFIIRIILAICVVLIGCSLSDTSLIHRLVNKIACFALGITVTIENPEKQDNAEVYISNNSSLFDHLAVHSATGSVSPGTQMHPALSKGLGLHYFGNQSNSDAFKRTIIQFIAEQKMSLHFTPEDKVTNGKAILKFKTYPFSIANKIQPICIRTKRPFFDISITTLGASFWTDVICYMFSPITHYSLKFLPPLEKKSLQDEEFSEIVRQQIAAELNVELSNFTSSDLLEWEKRQLVQQQSSSTVSRTFDPEIRTMATRVKEVLPHVPLNVIYKDLSKTKSVDNTITRILEGRVAFFPEEIRTASQVLTTGNSNTSSPSTSISNDLFNTAASLFYKSARDRTSSFQERKEQLISNARKRYIKKHNIAIV